MNDHKYIKFILLSVSIYSISASAIDVKTASKLINEMSETICGKMLYDSKTHQASLSGEATVKVNNLLAKIAELGGTVKGDVSTTGYYGVAQSDLPETIKSSQACRTHIFDSLSGLLTNQPVTLPLTPISASEAPQPSSSTTVIVNGNDNQTATGTSDTTMIKGH